MQEIFLIAVEIFGFQIAEKIKNHVSFMCKGVGVKFRRDGGPVTVLWPVTGIGAINQP